MHVIHGISLRQPCQKTLHLLTAICREASCHAKHQTGGAKNDKALAAFPNHRCQSKKHLQSFKGLHLVTSIYPIYRSMISSISSLLFTEKSSAVCTVL